MGQAREAINLHVGPSLPSLQVHPFNVDAIKHHDWIGQAWNFLIAECPLRLVEVLRKCLVERSRFGLRGVHNHDVGQPGRHWSRGRCAIIDGGLAGFLLGDAGILRLDTLGWVGRSCPAHGTYDWRPRFHIAKESNRPAVLPVNRVVIFDPQSFACRAEKRMLRRVDHDGGVPAPYGEIARSWICDSLKACQPVIKLSRRSIRIRKARLLVDLVHQVRAVAAGVKMEAGVKSGSDDGQTFIRRQQAS
jgi:hypothetical protein